jgi:hypothetical protein
LIPQTDDKMIKGTILIVSVILFTFCSNPAQNVNIEEVSHIGRPHFKISTQTATYYLDRHGAGITSVMDKDGIDWVNYHGDPHISGAKGASSGYRGLGNLVFRSDDGGAGHPGFDQCDCKIVSEKEIYCESHSGNWAWTWAFEDQFGKITIEKTDPNHAYWFLYEGPVGGKFNPSQHYWGTDQGGPRHETPSLHRGEAEQGHWHWAYFGDQEVDGAFFVAQEKQDDLVDYFAYMGDDGGLANESKDGMVVFGFGRGMGAKPLMTEPGNVFYFGFFPERIQDGNAHTRLADYIHSIVE